MCYRETGTGNSPWHSPAWSSAPAPRWCEPPATPRGKSHSPGNQRGHFYRQRNDISFNCPVNYGPFFAESENVVSWLSFKNGPLIGGNHRPVPALYLPVTEHTDAPHLSPLDLSNWKSSTLNCDSEALTQYPKFSDYMIEKYSTPEI